MRRAPRTPHTPLTLRAILRSAHRQNSDLIVVVAVHRRRTKLSTGPLSLFLVSLLYLFFYSPTEEVLHNTFLFSIFYLFSLFSLFFPFYFFML